MAFSMAQMLSRLEDRQLRAHTNLSYRQFRLLNNISRGLNTVRDLARTFAITTPAVSESVEALAKRGFIQRATGADDRRIVELTLTPEGEEVLTKARTAVSELGDALFGDLEPDAIAAFETIRREIYPGLRRTYLER